jgi:type IV secretion system protein VirD4
MEGLIVIGTLIVVFVVFLNYRARYRTGYQQGRYKGVADYISSGGKPWGQPLGGQSHGSAYFLDTTQLIEQNLADDIRSKGSGPSTAIRNRIWLGGHVTVTIKGNERSDPIPADLYAPMEGHILTVAPSRSGKGTCHVIPNLLNYVGSVVVNDVKGENAAISIRHRMEDEGQGAYVFAPFGEASACWNPFDCIRTGPDAWEDSALLADMLVVPRKYADGFWDESARNLLRGVILHLVTSGSRDRRNLATVRNILAATPAAFSMTLADMQ